MQRKVGVLRFVLLTPFLAGSGSCIGELQEKVAGLTAEVAELRSINAAQQRRLDDFEHTQTTYQLTTDFTITKLSSRVECEDVRVRDFLKECEQGADVCSSSTGLGNAMKWFATQPYTRLLCRPGGPGLKGLPVIRQGQLLTLTEVNSLKPATRFLILVKPASDSAADQKEAMALGRQLHELLREEYKLPHKTAIIGPRVLPCKLKNEVISGYNRPVDQPVKGEPSTKESSIQIYAFRTEC